MGLAILHCRAQYGTEAPPVTIEVFLSGGLPAFTIVGMAETAVRESKDRVRGALVSSGFEFPQQRITVSLGPAAMRKTGGRYDLAIALGILAARRQFPGQALDGVECYGELALSGELRPVAGLLPAVIKAHAAGRSVIVPRQNAAEAALVDGCSSCSSVVCNIDSYCCSTLWDATCVQEADQYCSKSCGLGSGCAHDECDAGDALDDSCSSCAAAASTTS